MDKAIKNKINSDTYIASNITTGLSNYEVQQLAKDGKENIVSEKIERTTQDIVFSYVFTLFNGLNFTLLLLVLLTGKFTHATFAMVIIVNTVSGIIQELRAKRQIDKISLLHTMKVHVLRDGNVDEIEINQVVEGDILCLDAGDQIIVDGVVVKDYAEINEALLTGEVDAIPKTVGDTVYSGSFVSSGSIYVQAVIVGDDTYINRLAHEAKSFKMSESELMRSIKKIVKWVTFAIIPLGSFLMLSQMLFANIAWRNAITGSVAGIIGMIPQGLVLLTTVAFMVGITKLAKHHALVQELPAIEMLARVNTICFDKTGTITEGKIELKTVNPSDGYEIAEIERTLGDLGQALPSANATLEAIKEKYPESKLQAEYVVPFSSSKKWSGATFANGETWVLGAPEVVAKNVYTQYQEYIEQQAKEGLRLLVLCQTNASLESQELPENLEIVAFLLFTDIVRESSPRTLQYFADQQVDVKIISGDSPVTVEAIARKAGLQKIEGIIDGPSLPEDMATLQELVKTTTIFGRVTPQQKQQLVEALQLNGRVVGMTGDGVNDVLALKQADCAIAMAAGSEAARAVSQVVLLNSDFSSLPKIVDEGRQIVNNISQVASLYLIKTLYSILFSIIYTILRIPYPFDPLQLSLVSSLMVGIPTFFLTLEKNTNPIEGKFLEKVVGDTIPGALTIVIAILVAQLGLRFFGIEGPEASTLFVLILGGIQLFLLLKISYPWKRWIGVVLFITTSIFISVFFIPKTQELLNVMTLHWYWYPLLFVYVLGALFIFNHLKAITQKIYQHYLQKRQNLSK